MNDGEDDCGDKSDEKNWCGFKDLPDDDSYSYMYDDWFSMFDDDDFDWENSGNWSWGYDDEFLADWADCMVLSHLPPLKPPP
jgi:hypothetical protein